jgi:hypothetical protein
MAIATQGTRTGDVNERYTPAAHAAMEGTVTLRQACRIHGIEVEPLVAVLGPDEIVACGREVASRSGVPIAGEEVRYPIPRRDLTL